MIIEEIEKLQSEYARRMGFAKRMRLADIIDIMHDYDVQKSIVDWYDKNENKEEKSCSSE